MSKLFIYPYIARSKSILSLVRELRAAESDVKLIALRNSIFKHGGNKVVVNWGSSALPLAEIQRDGPVINPRTAVQVCANKQRFFTTVGDRARTPEFTVDPDVARRWVADGVTVVARQVLNGHSGEGIQFSDGGHANFFNAPLFTKYVPKKQEFRVHIWDGQVIDVQQKKLRTHDENGVEVDRDDINFRVRSYNNGFVFARNEIRVPDDVTAQALNAIRSIPNLTFGAVDVIYNERRNEAYVLEINTAPGLEGQTLTNYVSILKDL